MATTASVGRKGRGACRLRYPRLVSKKIKDTLLVYKLLSPTKQTLYAEGFYNKEGWVDTYHLVALQHDPWAQHLSAVYKVTQPLSTAKLKRRMMENYVRVFARAAKHYQTLATTEKGIYVNAGF